MAYEGGRCLTDQEIWQIYNSDQLTEAERILIQEHEQQCDSCFDKIMNAADQGFGEPDPPIIDPV
jgi:hypothetical protein